MATAVSIDRFETAGKLVGYYGVFPEEWQSGVDKFGNPIPTGKKIMCRKGNDLVRGLLWQCAKCASAENGGNPAVRALYLRRLAAGDTPQIAWGYCMTKLLRQVFGVWTTGHGVRSAARSERTREDRDLGPQRSSVQRTGSHRGPCFLGTRIGGSGEPSAVHSAQSVPARQASSEQSAVRSTIKRCVIK